MNAGFFSAIYNSVVLPAHVSAFEHGYLRRMNRIGLMFFALHVPAVVAIAYFNHTGPLLALVLALGIVAGPALAYASLDNPRLVSVVYGFTAMLMGGLLVHVGQGPVQIEMHFYFFALIAMLAVYGNPLVIVVAAVTVALHHLVLWLVIPASVFNYEAPIWVVAVHAAFVVLESIATCFIARSFFDNVIGLERIVNERTRELDTRNTDMRLVLDNVGQGFLTIDLNAVVSKERSATAKRWLGDGTPGQTFGDYVTAVSPSAGDAFRLAFSQVVDQVLPLELALNQLPKSIGRGEEHFELSYAPIRSQAGALERLLIVITDVSAQVARERLEAEQRELFDVFAWVARDKAGFLEFVAESSEQVSSITADRGSDLATLTRVVHTLKGNASVFGLQSIVDLCHALETNLIDEQTRPDAAQRAELQSRWLRVCGHLDLVLGEQHKHRFEIDEADYEAVMGATLERADHARIAQLLRSWKLEPTAQRLARLSEQAQGIARRLNKPPLEIDLADHGVRLDPTLWAPFWTSFVHVLRNAVDHGLESAEEREAAGKQRAAKLTLATRLVEDDLIIEIADDGHGIDWDRVALAAASKGIPHATREQLIEAIFCDGVSTSTHVSEYSGRGVGMGAVRSACVARGGNIAVHSEAGAGTRVSFRFPNGARPAKPTITSQTAA